MKCVIQWERYFLCGNSHHRFPNDQWLPSPGIRRIPTWSSSDTDSVRFFDGLTFDHCSAIDDRAKRIPGTIALFTLNNSYPDTLIQADSTVLSIDCLSSKPWDTFSGLIRPTGWSSIVGTWSVLDCLMVTWWSMIFRCLPGKQSSRMRLICASISAVSGR